MVDLVDESIKKVWEEWDEWKPLPNQEAWEIFKNAKLRKWLNPVAFPESIYSEADKKYEEFMQQQKLFREFLKKHGERVDSWLLEEKSERKVGFRAQKWFSEMLFDLKVPHDSELKWQTLSENFFKVDLDELGLTLNEWKEIYYALSTGPDINIDNFGTVEVKSTNNIKKTAWDSNPSLFLVKVKACDKESLSFQFVGWLYGHEVYKLRFQKKEFPLYPKSHYFLEDKELRNPQEFLEKLLEISRAKPEL